MRIKEIATYLENDGWEYREKSGPDKFVVYELQSGGLLGICTYERRGRYSINPIVVSTKKFSRAVGKISKIVDNFGAILKIRAPLKLSEPFDCSELKDGLAKIISLAENVNISEELERLRGLPTNSIGSGPVLHMAALALNGETTKLEYYLKEFEAGNRLEFMPYITIEYILRAIEIAKNPRGVA